MSRIRLSMVLMSGLWALPWIAARADVKPHALISDGMVLQQGRRANLWGTADVGEKVTVRFRDQEASISADTSGRWLLSIESGEPGGPLPMTIAGQNTLELKNVFVGEVWLCSGQSNMGWPVAPRPGSKELIGTENPLIRLFTVPEQKAHTPARDLAASWQACGPDTVGRFSAVGYYFGRDLQRSLGVPVGLIHASFGGSSILQWISGPVWAESPQLEPLRQQDAKAAAKRAEAEKRGPSGRPAAAAPTAPSRSGLYNAMIAPLLPFSIRGVLWYQGEADTNHPADYRVLLPTLITSWRREFGQGDFPFLCVQLAPYLTIVEQPQESAWAELREAQLLTSMSLPSVGLAVITDWGHSTDIHTKPKQPVGERLALIARGRVYGKPEIYSGPLCTSATVTGNRMVLAFKNVGAGLVAKKLVLEDVRTDGRSGLTGGALHVAPDASADVVVPLQGFAIAGDDRQFVKAEAVIQGATVVVSSPSVERPSVVRYGWADYPTGNLFNREGLPATPFRTDGPPLVLEPGK